MAITKTTEIARIEVVGTWNVQVAADIVIKEDDTEIGKVLISKNYHIFLMHLIYHIPLW